MYAEHTGVEMRHTESWQHSPASVLSVLQQYTLYYKQYVYVSYVCWAYWCWDEAYRVMATFSSLCTTAVHSLLQAVHLCILCMLSILVLRWGIQSHGNILQPRAQSLVNTVDILIQVDHQIPIIFTHIHIQLLKKKKKIVCKRIPKKGLRWNPPGKRKQKGHWEKPLRET